MVYDVGLIVFPWHPSLETGRGHDTYTYHLLRHLSKADLDVRIYPIIKIKHLQRGVNKLDYITKEALFLTKVLIPKTKIYHGISPLGSKTAIVANKHPIITTIHDVIPFIHRIDVRQAYERLCINLCCKRSQKIIVSSDFTANYLVNKLGIDPEKMRIIRYGVDHTVFKQENKKENDEKTIFSIVRWSNLKQFLTSFRLIKDEVKNVKLLLGLTHSFDGDYTQQAPYILKKLNLEDSVEVLHDIPFNKLPQYYNTADAYVSASLGGFSLTLLEAMACGTPVIAFDLLDVPEYIEQDGVLVKPNDFNALADATIQLLSDKKLSKKLSEISIKKSRHFSWGKMALETLETYKELIKF